MKKINTIFLLLTILFLQSCATGPDLSDPKVREAISRVKIYSKKDLKHKKFKKIKSVKATICLTNAASFANSSEEGAKVELKDLASKVGANGLTNYMCHSKGLDMSTNCWNSTDCYADAIKIQY